MIRIPQASTCKSHTMSDHLSKTDKHLYHVPGSKKKQKKEIITSTSLAFASQLSSLISSKSTTSEPARGRARPASRSDIFTAHNKGSKKRAQKDLDDNDNGGQVFQQDVGGVDDSTLHRSKRKMEEKARLYSAMKRGDYVAGENEPEQLIDFDRKWAENEARGVGNEPEVLSSSEDDWGNGDNTELIEYEDDFGRIRTGTRAEKERMERKLRFRALGAEELDRMSARPAAPSQIIYGDTVQTAAFNPDEDTTYKMETLASKRDRSMTPPEAKHYEGDSEIRSRGTGFFAFSKDEEIRKQEMESLERERLETERIRRERDEKKEARKREIEQRRQEIAEKRAKKQADNFLENLGNNLEDKDD